MIFFIILFEMIGTPFKIRYGFKDFQNHMGISSNITLKGMIKRSMRKYPKTTKAVKTLTLVGGIYFILMSFIPGSSLPLQKPIKISILNFSQFFSKGWYYNIFNPDPQIYLIRINQILLAGIGMQVFDLQFTVSTFKKVREIYEGEKKQMSKSAFWDILIYSEIVLQNIIRYQKRLLLEKDIFQHYEWIFSTMTVQFQGVNVSEKQNSHLNLILTVIQYLLNFGQEKSKQKTIHSFYKLIRNCDPESQTSKLDRKILESSVRNKSFIQSLKSIYNLTTQQTLKTEILNIFDKMDIIYKATTPKHSPQLL